MISPITLIVSLAEIQIQTTKSATIQLACHSPLIRRLARNTVRCSNITYIASLHDGMMLECMSTRCECNQL